MKSDLNITESDPYYGLRSLINAVLNIFAPLKSTFHVGNHIYSNCIRPFSVF